MSNIKKTWVAFSVMLSFLMGNMPLTGTTFSPVMTVSAEEESITEYRYCIKNFTTSSTPLSAPYVYVSEESHYTDYGEWSSWSSNAVSASDTRQIETQVRDGAPESYVMVNYRTRGALYKVKTSSGRGVNVRSGPSTDYSVNGAAPEGTSIVFDKIEGNWGYSRSVSCTNGIQSGWVSMTYCTLSTFSNVQYRSSSVNGNYYANGLYESFGEYKGGPYTVSASTVSNARAVSSGAWTEVVEPESNYDGYNMSAETGYVLNLDDYSEFVWFIQSTNYAKETWYRYRDRRLETTYTYYTTGEWSEWSTEKPDVTEAMLIETREVPVEQKPETLSGGIVIGTDDYSFENYNGKITLSDTLASILDKNVNNLDWESIDKYLSGNKVYGHCYGMAAVQVLVKAGVLQASDVDSSADTLYDVGNPRQNPDVDNLLNYYVLLQKTKVIESMEKKYKSKSNQTKINELITLAENAQTSGNLALVCFSFTESASAAISHKYSGHAVVAYGAEYDSYYDGQYDCRILVSDPNVIGFDDDCCIYINTKNYEWTIPYYEKAYYSCTNHNENDRNNPYAKLCILSNDTELINYPKSNSGQEISVDSTISIASKSDSNYGVAYYQPERSDFISAGTVELLYYSDGFGGDTDNQVHAFLPEADTAYEYFEKDMTAFETSVDYTNSRFTADVTNGSYAIYQPDESVEFHGSNSDYTLSAVLNNGYYPTDWYKMEVSGTNADSAKITVGENGYILSGDGLAKGIFITASNRTHTAKRNLMTDAESVLVYQTDENTIGIRLDTNADGIYETPFYPEYIGDVNEDNAVSVVDVIALQKYLLGKHSISRQQYIKADFNQDGEVNIFDLAFLKRALIKQNK